MPVSIFIEGENLTTINQYSAPKPRNDFMNALTNSISALVTGFFNRKKSGNVLKTLKILEQNRRRLQFQFQGDTAQFSCTVETVDASHGIVVIGNIFPKPVTLSRSRARKLLLATAHAESRVQMASKFLQPLIGESSELLMLKLPSKLHNTHGQESSFFNRARGVHQPDKNAFESSASARCSESQAA